MMVVAGLGRITDQQEVKLPVTFVYEDIVAREKPVYWGVSDDRTAGALSRHREVITETLGVPVRGATIPDSELYVSVPVDVVQGVENVDRGVEIVFVLTTGFAQQGGIFVVPKAGITDFDEELATTVLA